MTCNLVKKSETYTDKKGKTRKIWHFFLVIEGVKVPILLRNYSSEDSSKQADLDKYNLMNYTRLSLCAEDISDSKEDK